MTTFPNKVIVTSCMGGSQGDLGVVRALGRAGVSVILLSEYASSIAQYSRYAVRMIHEPGFTQSPDSALACLMRIAETESHKPIIFPTADPDLTVLSNLRDKLEPHFHLFLSTRELIDTCLDKGKFFDFAKHLNFPIPHTYAPNDLEELIELSHSISYPTILKPLIPQTWSQPEIQRIVDEKKALVIDTPEALIDQYRAIAPLNKDMAIQDYIPGRDDRLYSLHIYMDRQGQPVAYFTGQKIRTYPTYAGIGCFVRSVYVPDIVSSGVDILRKLHYTGMALLQFKQDSRTGEFKLLEINPRASSWNLLAERCGVNLPYLACLETLGMDLPPRPRQNEGVNYVFFSHDIRAFLDYRKHGDWSTWAWLRSLLGRNVFQYWCLDDPKPFFVSVGRALMSAGKRVTRRVTRHLRPVHPAG